MAVEMTVQLTAETSWFEPRGVPFPVALADARVELHWAAQVIAAVARALIRAVPDDSHTSLEWLPSTRLLAGKTTPRQLRIGLRPTDLTLVVVDGAGAVGHELPLAGRKLDEALAWASDRMGGAALGPPPYEMPEHAVAHGGVFRGDDLAACAELGRWYASADRCLRAGAFLQQEVKPDDIQQASPVRCWPHHFDIATLITLPPLASGGGGARSIGVGLSPGDGSYAQPYFYVTPWPYPKDPPLPPLPGGGVWHQTGWFGAVLTGAAVCAGGPGGAGVDPGAGATIVSEFLRVAARASSALLAAP
jgi:hypothetical protein